MSIWINPELKGFNQLGDFINVEFDSTKESCRFDCSEIRFLPLDNGDIVIGMSANSISNVHSKCDIKYPFNCATVVHAESFELYDLNEKKKVTVQPSLCDKLMLRQLASVDLTKCYGGYIEFKPVLAEVWELIEQGLVPVDKIVLHMLAEIPECKTIGSLRLESSKNGSKKGGGYAAKAQTELERLSDREKFLGGLITQWNPSKESVGTPLGDWAGLSETEKEHLAAYFIMIAR